jgi:hypothetical protein
MNISDINKARSLIGALKVCVMDDTSKYLTKCFNKYFTAPKQAVSNSHIDKVCSSSCVIVFSVEAGIVLPQSTDTNATSFHLTAYKRNINIRAHAT